MLYEMRKDAIENIIDVLESGYSGYYCDCDRDSIVIQNKILIFVGYGSCEEMEITRKF